METPLSALDGVFQQEVIISYHTGGTGTAVPAAGPVTAGRLARCEVLSTQSRALLQRS